MSEFEYHQLLITTRSEFETMTLALVVINLAFVAIAIWQKSMMSKQTNNWLKGLCLLVSAFLALRVVEGTLRFMELNNQLIALNPEFDPAALFVHWTALILRLLIVLVFPLVALWFLDQARKPYS